MRVEVDAEQGVGLPYHSFGDVGVQVQRAHNRDGVSDDRADGLKHVGFEVVGVRGHPRPVERQAHSVYPTGRLKGSHEGVLQRLVGLRSDDTRRIGEGRESGQDLHARRFRAVDHASEIVPHAPVPLQYFLSLQPLEPLEGLHGSRHPGEGVRFVAYLAYGDLHAPPFELKPSFPGAARDRL